MSSDPRRWLGWLAFFVSGCQARPPDAVETSTGLPLAFQGARRAVASGDLRHRAEVVLPASAAGHIHLADRDSGLALDVSLTTAQPVAPENIDGLRVYRRALGEGADLAQEVTDEGVEDTLSLSRPLAEPALAYLVELGAEVAGLRLVGGTQTLEVLDAGGFPRLRVAPPSLVDSAGQRRAARLSVEGCPVDRDPRAPWSRPVTPLVPRSCTLRVAWDDEGLRYPIAVDPFFSATGSMIRKREDHVMVLLATGDVLVAGGSGSTGVSNTAELYHPATGVWATTGNLTAVRYFSSRATRLANGQVLVTGGTDNYFTSLRSAEVYDPAHGWWTATGLMPIQHAGHTATLLANGKVLIAGGQTSVSTTTRSCELFDPTGNNGLGSFAPTGALAHERSGHTASVLANGEVIVVGAPASSYDGATEIYSPASGAWRAGPPLAKARRAHAMAALAGGKLVIAGGTYNGTDTLASTEVYDPQSNSWSAAGALVTARRDGVLVALDDGRLLLAGGTTAAGSATAATEIFDPVTFTWTASGDMTLARRYHQAVVLPDHRALVAGGATGTGVVASAEVYITAPTCASATDCAAGQLCADGFCCDSACTGPCDRCDLAGKEGTCTFLAAGSNPGCSAYTCPGTSGECRTSCAADGDCATGNYCDAGGSCVPKLGDGVACAEAHECTSGFCNDGVCCNRSCAGSCETCSASLGATADGTCTYQSGTAGDPSCFPYRCPYRRSGCSKNCTEASCVAGYFCNYNTEECQSQRPLGATCSAYDQCQSGFCTDGVCCDQACGQLCDVCAASLGASADGTCTPSPPGSSGCWEFVHFRVSQESAPGAGDFDANVLGFVTPVNIPGLMGDYYRSNQSFAATTPATFADASHVFVVQAADGTFLVVVHDKVGNGTSGYAEMRIDLSGYTNWVAPIFWVLDDVVDDHAQSGYVGPVSYATGNTWSGCCTDGFAIGAISGRFTSVLRFTNVPEFNTANPNVYLVGLTQWLALSGDGSRIPLALVKDRRVRIDAVQDVDPVVLETGPIGTQPLQLSPLPDVQTALTTDINDSGQVVGQIELAGQSPQAFTWTRAAGTTTLGTLGGSTSIATAVNNGGLVVGESATAGGGSLAFSWTQDSGMSVIASLPPSAHPTDVNDLGEIVGTLGDAATGQPVHGFFFSPTAGLFDLGGLGGSSTRPAALNNLGLVVGGASLVDGRSQAFTWTRTDGLGNLGETVGLANCEAVDVNDLGQIAGRYKDGGDVRSFFFSRETGMVDLGSLGASPVFTVAKSINNRGQIVGQSQTAAGELHSFLWTQQGGIADLDASGTALSGALAISNSGQLLGFTATPTGVSVPTIWSDRLRVGYRFTRLADTRAADSAQILRFAGTPVINRSGHVAYIADRGPPLSNRRIERLAGAQLVVVAAQGPDYGDFLRLAINGADTVAFAASTPDGGRALGKGDGFSDATLIVETDPGNYYHFVVDPDVAINDASDLVYTLRQVVPGSSSYQILEKVLVARGDGGSRRVDCTDLICQDYVSTPHVLSAYLGGADINAGGSVAYWKNMDHRSEEGIAIDGAPLVRAKGTSFYQFAKTPIHKARPAINDLGFVAFYATVDEGLDFGDPDQPPDRVPAGAPGIFGTYRGGPIFSFADSFGGAYGDFADEVSLNASSKVAFFARAGGVDGIFTGPDPVRDKVVAVGDPLDGSTATALRFGRGGLNDKGQLVFFADLADGRTGLFRAEPPVGSLPESPELPQPGDPGGPYLFSFASISTGGDIPVYVDPIVAVGYEYAREEGSPNFASVILPAGIGDGRYDLWLFDEAAGGWRDSGVDIVGGVPYPFPTGGVDRFRILGIEAAALLDPGDARAFPTGLTFTYPGHVTMSMTPLPLLANAAPRADAGADRTVEATGPLTEVVLDGAGSSDRDDDELLYLWTWDGGSADGVSPAILLPLGEHAVKLLVSDGSLTSEVSTMRVRVEDTTPPAPDQLRLPEWTGECQVSIPETPTATDLVDGTIVGTTADPRVYTVPGTYTITWSFADRQGNVSTQTHDVQVTVRPAGLESPMAALVEDGELPPLPAQDFQTGRTLPLKLQLSCAGVGPPRFLAVVAHGAPAPDPGGAGEPFHPTQTGWSYGLKTRGLVAGAYDAVIGLPDGRRFRAAFELR